MILHKLRNTEASWNTPNQKKNFSFFFGCVTTNKQNIKYTNISKDVTDKKLILMMMTINWFVVWAAT